MNYDEIDKLSEKEILELYNEIVEIPNNTTIADETWYIWYLDTTKCSGCKSSFSCARDNCGGTGRTSFCWNIFYAYSRIGRMVGCTSLTDDDEVCGKYVSFKNN